MGYHNHVMFTGEYRMINRRVRIPVYKMGGHLSCVGMLLAFSHSEGFTCGLVELSDGSIVAIEVESITFINPMSEE